jgi:multiple sugar transport system ATP-binding protein
MAGTPRAEIERKVGRAAEVLQLGPLLQRKPGALSGGQRQRVAIGRAIVRTPKVFLFDEPLSNLDASLRVQMRMELARLHRELGSTMIYVTHDQVEAMTLGQRIAVLNQGRLEQVGSPLTLFDTPANRFVAGFLGSPRMNFIAAQPGASCGGRTVMQCGGAAVWQVLGTFDQPCCLGVRPEDLQLAAPGVGLQAVVQAVEHLGDTVIAHVQPQGLDELLTVRLPPDRRDLQRSDTVWLLATPERVHVFDAQGRACPRAQQEPAT